MSMHEQISEERLSAFIDGQLDAEEYAQVLEALRRDEAAAQKVWAMREDMELLALAYRDPPLPRDGAIDRRPRRTAARLGTAAAALLMLLGAVVGWFIGIESGGVGAPAFEEVAHFDAGKADASKILLHISTMDHDRIEAALDTAEEVMESRETAGRAVQLEVIANAEGLGVLRAGSPYARRIHELATRHRNIKFLACGIARENARLKEGGEIKLIPEATEVPAALEQILSRVKLGWLYIRA
jgi:intracellular sulfur oxidation DsrE/DsrF family protein